jgi:hypothetical protein
MIEDQRSCTDKRLGQALESRLGEMLVERKRSLDSPAFHHDKRHAIGQGIAFVGLVGEFTPSLGEYRLVNVHESNYPAVKQCLADRDCFGVMPAAIEERRNLVEYVRGGHEPNATLAKLTPRGYCGVMVLIVCRFERDQKTGVEKICRHDPLYKWAS